MRIHREYLGISTLDVSPLSPRGPAASAFFFLSLIKKTCFHKIAVDYSNMMFLCRSFIKRFLSYLMGRVGRDGWWSNVFLKFNHLKIFQTLYPYTLSIYFIFIEILTEIMWVLDFGQVGKLPQRSSKSTSRRLFLQNWFPTSSS